MGLPVDPEVKITQASSSMPISIGPVTGSGESPVGETVRSRPMIAVTSASPKTSWARSSGSSKSTGTYAAPASIAPRIAT